MFANRVLWVNNLSFAGISVGRSNFLPNYHRDTEYRKTFNYIFRMPKYHKKELPDYLLDGYLEGTSFKHKFILNVTSKRESISFFKKTKKSPQLLSPTDCVKNL